MGNELMFKSEEEIRNLHKGFGTELRGYKKADVMNALKSLAEEWGMAIALLSKNGIDLNIQDFYGGEAFSAPTIETDDFMSKFSPNNQNSQNIASSNIDIEELKRENAYLSEDNLNKHLEIEALKARVDELTSMIENSSANTLSNFENNSTIDSSEILSRLAESEAKVKELEEDLIACANSASEGSKEEIDALISTIQEQDATIMTLKEDIKLLSESTGKDTVSSEEINMLLAQIDESKNEVSALVEKLRVAEEELTSLRLEKEEMSSTLISIQNETSNVASEEITSLKLTIDELTTNLSAVAKEKENLIADLEKNKITNSNIDSKLQELRNLETEILAKEAKIQNDLIEIQRVRDIMSEKEAVIADKENMIAQNKELVSEDYLKNLQEKEASLEKANKRMDTMISIAEQTADKLKADAEQEAALILEKAEENKNKILEEAKAIAMESEENKANCEREIKEMKERAIEEANSITEKAEETANLTIENAEKVAIESQEKAKEKISELTNEAQVKLDSITTEITSKEEELRVVQENLTKVKTDCLDELQQIQFKIEKVVVDYQ